MHYIINDLGFHFTNMKKAYEIEQITLGLDEDIKVIFTGDWWQVHNHLIEIMKDDETYSIGQGQDLTKAHLTSREWDK